MKKTTIFFALLALSLIISVSENAIAYDQYYLLKQGHEAKNTGDTYGAIQSYQDYINSHPFSKHLNSSKAALLGASGTPSNSNQYLLRNLLIAYENLFDVLRENGQREEINVWLTNLKAIYKPGSFGSKNSYNLARVLQENDRLTDSTMLLEDIVTRQIEEYKPGNNKVLLRAAGKLMKIYAKQGKTEQQLILLKNLQQCQKSEFDNKDKLKLATLFLKNAQTKKKGEQLLTEIIDRADNDPSMNTATLLKAKISLMECKYQNKDKEGLDCIANQCSTLILNDNLSPSSSYELAVAFLKYNKKNEGKKLLRKISIKHPDTIWARKSLFLLGRTALSEEDWDTAIEHYSAYIERYPEQTFFCLKAYSNILDAYWSRDGDLEKQQLQIDQFADIINQTADYETQLNMARELSYKGFPQLADSTFILGYTNAQDTISSYQASLSTMRVNWQLTKYGFEVGRYSIARESGELVIEQHAQLYDSLTDTKEKEKADHYLSRTILWLAKLYEGTHENNKAKEVLQRFVVDFPHDTDTDYATYQLGRLFEQDKQFPEAIELYQKIEKAQWRKKANQALQRIETI